MGDLTDQKVWRYSRIAGSSSYDINASFGDGEIGRFEKCLVSESGKFHLDDKAWEAGDVAYQCLKQLYPKGITAIEFTHIAKEFYFLACKEMYPDILSLAEAGKIDIQPTGLEGLKEAWKDYDWCERVMFVFDFIEGAQDIGGNFDNPLNTALPLVLLQRLDDAVIAQFCDGNGLSSLMLEIASLRDRLQPPKHVQAAIKKLQVKVDTFTQARRKGADVTHTQNRNMKAEVFIWLDSQAKFKSIEAAAMAITKQQPIAHVTGREWYKEWKKLRSASTP